MEFALLGSHPQLSLAEMETVVQKKASAVYGRVALFDELATELSTLQGRLGGTVKLGFIVGSFHSFKSAEIASFLASILIGMEGGKKVFGISILDSGDTERFSHAEKLLREIGRLTKNELKEFGSSARFIEPKDHELSAATLKFNRVLEKGAEFILIFTPKEIFVGQTAAVQDVDDWAKRDFHRPARDARRGMLPPKLARMMVNLASADVGDKILLDPFCGSGTVLMEANFIGYEKVMGGDISSEAIEDTKRNLAWLQERMSSKVELYATKASNLPAFIQKPEVDVVVTEPFLGKPRAGNESIREVKQAIFELEELYRESFKGIRKVMKAGGVLVLVSPVHLIGKERIPVASEEILSSLGFMRDQTLPPLYYEREGQFVGRSIERYLAV